MTTKISFLRSVFQLFAILHFLFAASVLGLEVPSDDQISKWRKGAEQGNVEAQLLMGDCYDRGKGVAKNPAEALKWFRKAADQGNPSGQYGVGLSYGNGYGVRKNAEESVKWFRKAAEQGHAQSQNLLGLAYFEGVGVKKSAIEATKWLRKAAEQGHSGSQYNMGTCFRDGEGVRKDPAEAVHWYRKSAEQGYTKAQYEIGLWLALGEGVVKDEIEAYKWWLLASASGDKNAKKNVTVSETRLTRGQIAEGQKLARNFKPSNAPEPRTNISGQQGADSKPRFTGTGFFITEDGFLITNNHVVNGSPQIRLATSGGLLAAKVVKIDAVNDLALLKAEGKFAALPVTTSRAMKLGGSVATVGFPNIGLQGFSPKLAKGEIASLSGAADDARYFQISVPVQPGNSGGALVDERGNVVGVVSAKLSAAATLAATGSLPENVNYAVKGSFLLGFLESVPEVASALKEPNTKEDKFETVVKTAEQATVLVLVY